MRNCRTDFIILLLFWPLSLMSQSQDFWIRDFHQNMTDLSAISSYVKDLNGKSTALIRFAVRDSKFEFSANLGIVKQERRTGEVCLYVPVGTKRLTIRHPHLGILRGYEIPTAVEGKCTYDAEIVITNALYLQSLYAQQEPVLQQEQERQVIPETDILQELEAYNLSALETPKSRKNDLPDDVGDYLYSSDEQSPTTRPSSQSRTFTVDGVQFKMINVEGGTFSMGAISERGSDAEDDEKPAHTVSLSSYSIGETEVTQALWQAVMGSNPSYFSDSDLPVEMVSWNDCQEFINKLNAKTGQNFRLPTEAEWEFAARGGNRSLGYKYAGSNTISNVAWYWDNIQSQINGTAGYGTQNVANKQMNELGLYDMSGNVWEWCSDWYSRYSKGSQTNPMGPSSGGSRVYRGGSWFSNARTCCVTFRFYSSPSTRNSHLGFRLAL